MILLPMCVSHSVMLDSLQPPWAVAHQAPLSMEFSRQKYWGGLPFPSPGDLPNPGIKPRSPALLANSSLSELPGKPTKGTGLHGPGSNPGSPAWQERILPPNHPRTQGPCTLLPIAHCSMPSFGSKIAVLYQHSSFYLPHINQFLLCSFDSTLLPC